MGAELGVFMFLVLVSVWFFKFLVGFFFKFLVLVSVWFFKFLVGFVSFWFGLMWGVYFLGVVEPSQASIK